MSPSRPALRRAMISPPSARCPNVKSSATTKAMGMARLPINGRSRAKQPAIHSGEIPLATARLNSLRN